MAIDKALVAGEPLRNIAKHVQGFVERIFEVVRINVYAENVSSLFSS